MRAQNLACWGHRKKDEEEVDPEQARKDLERLEFTRKKRWGPSLAGCANCVVINVWMAGMLTPVFCTRLAERIAWFNTPPELL